MNKSVTLTPKETSLLTDLRNQEQVCVEKTARYASQACDGQLKNLFTQISTDEARHVQMIDQLFSGTLPQVNAGSSPQPQFQKSSCPPESMQQDSYLCSDMLSTEKHVSSQYDTSIFEFTDENVRDVLNHIQKEEQCHGKRIYDYMAANGMYN
ncbi:MAG: spore coat protein [Oscillospiraceae bacterium]|nr:spore coat protein [Oscillospiraceae bacterium]